MIRTLVAHEGALFCGALSFVLGVEHDIDVVAEVGRFRELANAVRTHRPDVTVLDLDLLRSDDLVRPDGQLALDESLRLSAVPGNRVLVLAEPRQSHLLKQVVAGGRPGLGFLAKERPPGWLVAAVRKVAGGEPVLDPELVVSALQERCPLTAREIEVLGAAAAGAPIAEVAQQLGLALGTVRNHLSRVIGKTGARSRIEAVRIAQDAGWIVVP